MNLHPEKALKALATLSALSVTPALATAQTPGEEAPADHSFTATERELGKELYSRLNLIIQELANDKEHPLKGGLDHPLTAAARDISDSPQVASLVYSKIAIDLAKIITESSWLKDGTRPDPKQQRLLLTSLTALRAGVIYDSFYYSSKNIEERLSVALSAAIESQAPVSDLISTTLQIGIRSGLIERNPKVFFNPLLSALENKLHSYHEQAPEAIDPTLPFRYPETTEEEKLFDLRRDPSDL